MNQTPSAGLSHPLVAAYLSDLEQALSSVDQQERIDTIASVREHLTDALGVDGLGAEAEPTTERVKAVLHELGSVEQIAASATPSSAAPASIPPASTPPSSASPTGQKQEGGWAAPALLAASIVSLVIPLFGAVLAIGCLVAAIVLLRSGAPRRGFLKATMAVSIATLVVNVLLVAGSLALFNVRSDVTSVPGEPVPASASYAPAPSQG
ncbi:HAAS signaling domain-containing protein [Demequina lutea]|uniref:Putative membrane protein n=1 Tax=Demequina lutea TaxID=431489 RepID=A0A7Z0CKV0_9MICO|nr:hypothetical protein [Demequina lutea]NYI42105.1 putative membrane protein [Demequina lutea]